MFKKGPHRSHLYVPVPFRPRPYPYCSSSLLPYYRLPRQAAPLCIHGAVVEVVPLALATPAAVLLLLLPVGVVIVLARDVALGASLLGTLGLRHLLVSGTAIS